MTNNVFRKGLVLGIIILLVAVSFTTSIGENIKKQNESKNNQIFNVFKSENMNDVINDNSPKETDWWPMFHHDRWNSGYSTGDGPETNNVLWSLNPGGGDLESSPAVYNGKVYFGSYSGKVFCYDVDTGVKIWDYPTNDEISKSSPAIANGKLYIGTKGTKLFCLNADTGDFNWAYHTNSAIRSSPAVVNGKVYFGDDDGYLYCIDADTGDFIWSYTAQGDIQSSPAVVNGKVYFGDDDGYLYCLDADDGSEKWSKQPDYAGSFISSPAILNNRVYLGSVNGKVYCYGGNAGSLIWEKYIGGWIYSSPAVYNNWVYIGSKQNERMYCLNAINGSEIWNYQAYYEILSSPALAGGKIYFGSLDDHLYCLNMYNGSLIWKYQTGGDILYASPAVADGKVFIGNCDNKMYCFEDIYVNEPPTIEITYPLEGQTVSGTETITGTADDPDGTVQLVEVKIDSGNWNTASGTTSWSYNWDTTTLPNGQHTIYARSYDGEDYSEIASVNVTVNNNQPPVADFTWTPEFPSAGETITFDASNSYDPDGTIVLYEWDWDNDGTYDESHTIPTATYSWPDPGLYPVGLRVTDNGTATNTTIKVVNVGDVNWPPVALFTWSPLNPHPGQTVTFDASESFDPDGYIVLYEWDWDNDGTYDESHTTPTATHDFDVAGNYPVTLRVTDNEDATNTTTKTVEVVENQPPVADFTWTPPNPAPPGNINFDASDSYDSDGIIVLYEWDWDDDGTFDFQSTDPYATKYFEEGTYPITLQVKDDDGEYDTEEKTLIVIDQPLSPIARFVWDPDSPKAGETITFDASSSEDPDGTIVLYEWDWADDGYYEESSTSPIITHSWPNPSCNEVRMQVTDNDGLQDWIMKVVNVGGEGPPDLIVEKITLPEYILVNKPYKIKWIIQNIGGEPANHYFKVKFLVKGPSDDEWTQLHDSPWNINNLDPGETIEERINWIPIQDEPGIWNIKVIVDSNNDIDESNENNNEKIYQVIVQGNVEVTPSVQYNEEDFTLDINAIIYNRHSGKYMKDGLVTWLIYDSDGNKIPGYGGTQDPFIFNTNTDRWENHHNDVVDLFMGDTYTVRVIWMLSTFNEIDFVVTSGSCNINGYITDWGTSTPISGANVMIYNSDDYWSGGTYIYDTISDGSGHYIFENIEPNQNKGYIISVTSPTYDEGLKILYAEDNGDYSIDFGLYISKWENFYNINNELYTSLNNVISDMSSSISTMSNDMHEVDADEVFWFFADAIGSIIVASAENFAAEMTEEQLKQIATRGMIDAIEESLQEAIEREGIKILIKELGMLILEDFMEDLCYEAKPVDWFENHKIFNWAENEIDIYFNEFKDAAMGVYVSDKFSTSRATKLINSVNDELNDIMSKNYVLIPCSFDSPCDLLFPESKIAFYEAYDFLNLVQDGSHATIIAQILLGITAIALLPIVGPASLALIPIAKGIGYAGDGIGLSEVLYAKPAMLLNYGIALGDYCKDFEIVPTILHDTNNFLLSEVENPYYMNEEHDFDVTCDITINWDDPGMKTVVSYWEGELKPDMLDIMVTNLKDPTKIFVNVDGRWFSQTKDYFENNDDWDVIGGSSGIDYMIPPCPAFIGGQVEFWPEEMNLKVEAYSGIFSQPTFSDNIRYTVVYCDHPDIGEDQNIDEIKLPLSSKDGKLEYNEYLEMFPDETVLFDGFLNAQNSYFDTSFTVSDDVGCVDFNLYSPSGSKILLNIIDEDGNRIGHDFATGNADLQFPGTYNGINSDPQIVSIPNAAGKTYHVSAQLSMMYSEEESYHIEIIADEVPIRDSIMFGGCHKDEISLGTGSEYSIPVVVGEVGGWNSLRNVSIELNDIRKDDVFIPILSSNKIDIGDILANDIVTILFDILIPENFPVGVYSGTIEINADDFETISIEIFISVSNPPGEPTIEGPKRFEVGKEYDYNFKSVDPEDEDVFYYVDWDDGNDSGWIGPYSSGQKVTLSHTWTEEGKKTISAIAKDVNDLVGPEATLEVSMPRNRATQRPFLQFLQNFLQQYPILYQLLLRFLRL